MTGLRVLVAVFLLLAVVGAASFAPLSSSLVIAATEKAGQADLLDINGHRRATQGAPWYWRGLHREDHQGATVPAEG